MKILRQTYKIRASKKLVWDALTDPKVIDKWGGGPVKMVAKEGTVFSFWGGDIHGKNIKVVKQKKLVQEWMSGKWEKYSTVTFDLEERNGVTTVKLTQTGIPEEEYDDIADGWGQFYLGEIKKLLEG